MNSYNPLAAIWMSATAALILPTGTKASELTGESFTASYSGNYLIQNSWVGRFDLSFQVSRSFIPNNDPRVTINDVVLKFPSRSSVYSGSDAKGTMVYDYISTTGSAQKPEFDYQLDLDYRSNLLLKSRNPFGRIADEAADSTPSLSLEFDFASLLKLPFPLLNEVGTNLRDYPNSNIEYLTYHHNVGDVQVDYVDKRGAPQEFFLTLNANSFSFSAITYEGITAQIPKGSDHTPSPVPLPASAPLFGAALVALGAAGYGLKRNGKAAARA